MIARVTLDESGVTRTWLFGRKEMRWRDLQCVYSTYKKEYLHGFRSNTYWHLKLVDQNGRKLRLGQTICNAQMWNAILQKAVPTILAKCLAEYNAGAELRFGRLRLSRDSGIHVNGFFNACEIPWEEIARYEMLDGAFCLTSVYRQETAIRVNGVPNAFVLVHLLDAICNQRNAER